MLLSSFCPHCQKRKFYPEPDEWHRWLPRTVKEAWKEALGSCPLGQYYVHVCEVCKRRIAVFDRNKKELEGRVVAFYQCSFTDKPYSADCASYESCYKCPYTLAKRKKRQRQEKVSNARSLEALVEKEEKKLRDAEQ